MIKISCILFGSVLSVFLSFACHQSDVPEDPFGVVEYWLTTPDKTILFEKQESLAVCESGYKNMPTLQLDTAVYYQQMDGFGYTLTGGSALWLYRMSPSSRNSILRELFSPDEKGIGVSYVRVSIGASDLDEYVFSYDDLPEGQTDPQLEHFSIDSDRRYLIPVLKEILDIYPELKILGSPWSAPTWMKTNGNAIGGSLMPEYFESYANYFLKYIKAMQDEGIRIDAITVQNEPLHPGNNPSMFMTADDQTLFIKNYLGPALSKGTLETKIIIYDHNADRIDYPLSILADPEAAKYIDGSAFHLYGGRIEDLTELHKAWPEKNLYFTEQWIGAPANFGGDLAWHTENLIIGASRNWCRTVLEWNLAADPNQEPHTDHGGCTRCLGAITIDGDRVDRNPAYYIIAHASKFVRPGAFRIFSSLMDGIPNVAFQNIDGSIVLIVLNKTTTVREFLIQRGNDKYKASMPAGSVGTFIL